MQTQNTEIDTRLSDIVELTPDYYQSLSNSGYGEMSKEFFSYQEFDRFIWNNFLTASESFYKLIKENPELFEQYYNHIQKTIDAVYGEKLSRSSKDKMGELIRKKISKDSLSGGVFHHENYSYPELYHGTGSSALFNILKCGELLSESRLYTLGIKVQTGERYRQNKRWRNDLISLTISPKIALDPHACIDGITYFDDFPVVLGFSDERINRITRGNGIVWNDYDAESGEVCARHELPMEATTHLFVPTNRINKLKNLVGGYDIEIVPLERLQAKCDSSDKINSIYQFSTCGKNENGN